MKGSRWIVGIAAAACATATVAGSAGARPVASNPTAAQLTLMATDFPGAVAAGGAVKDGGAAAPGYERLIVLKAPFGTSHYQEIVSIAYLVETTPLAARFYATEGHFFSSKAGRTALVKEFAKTASLSAGSATLITPRALGVGDSSMEAGFVARQAKGSGRVNLSISLVRVDRAVIIDVAIGKSTVVAKQDAVALSQLVVHHIDAAFEPGAVTPPSIGGSTVHGDTLAATTGSWNGAPTAYAYQWNRCDATGNACVAIPGATAPTYVLGSADIGTTLRVAVTASNHYGSATSTSAASATVG